MCFSQKVDQMYFFFIFIFSTKVTSFVSHSVFSAAVQIMCFSSPIFNLASFLILLYQMINFLLDL